MTEKIDTGVLLYKLYDHVKDRIYMSKEKYPLLRDHLDVLRRELDETKKNIDEAGPVTPELKSQFYLCLIRTEEILSKIENGQYQYLADKTLYELLIRAQKCGSNITNLYIKLLIASNILELMVNDKLAKVNHNKYMEMIKKDKSSIISKVQELNTYLKQYNKEIKIPVLVNITGQRNIVDHPDSDAIGQLDEKLVSDVIKTVDQIVGILEELK